MKNALLLILALAVASCAAPRRTASPSASSSRTEEASRFEKPPFVGMTKGQAAARYGKPRKRVHTEEGERWYYLLNKGEVLAKTVNPLSLTVPKYRTGVLLFDTNARVKRFAWEARPGR